MSFLRRFSYPSSDVVLSIPATIQDFVTQLDNQLQEQKLNIVNHPQILKQRGPVLKKAQENIKMQMDKMEKEGMLIPTTRGLMHLDDDEKLLQLDKVLAYYNRQAELTIQEKACTCQGICAVALKLAQALLVKGTIKNITVELCMLSNWSHTLIRISELKTDGKTKIFFYDPWYQRCHTDNSNKIKLFPEEHLSREMSELLRKTNMSHTKVFLDYEKMEKVNNANKDFSYFVMCSTGSFTNPTETVSLSTPAPASSLCTIC